MINVHIRGGIGDTAIAMLKCLSIRKRHTDEQIIAWVNSPRPRTVLQLIKCFYNPDGIFDDFQILSYIGYKHMKSEYWDGFTDCDKYYDMNNYNDGKLRIIEEIYPELEIDYYPKLASKEKNIGEYIVVQPRGANDNRIWDINKWEELLKRITIPVRSLGDANIFYRDIQEMINFINNAKMFIGIDSGLKNIALICKTPTLMLFDREKANANPKELWFPKEYQKEPNKILPVECGVGEVFEWIKEQ